MTNKMCPDPRFELIDDFKAMGHEINGYGISSNGNYNMQYKLPAYHIEWHVDTNKFTYTELRPKQGMEKQTGECNNMEELSVAFHLIKQLYDKSQRAVGLNQLDNFI